MISRARRPLLAGALWERVPVWAAAAGLAVLAGVFAGAGGTDALNDLMRFPGPGTHVHSHGGGGGPQLSDAGRRVGSGLKCPCGCPDLLLACDCTKAGGAAEVKRFITELLAGGRSEAETRIELVNRYGVAIQRATR